MNIPSCEHLFQLAFALSPFPAYMPQYFSIMKLQQLASSIAADGNDDAIPPMPHPTEESSPKIGNHQFRKRNNIPGDSPLPGPLQGIHRISNTPILEDPIIRTDSSNQNYNADTIRAEDKNLDAGLSRATVLLLLSAHLIRLLYFHGLILEEQRLLMLEPGASSDGHRLDELTGGGMSSTASTLSSVPISQETETSALQYDLLGQSISMIATQCLLLHAVMLLKRKQRKWQKRRVSDQPESTGSLPVSLRKRVSDSRIIGHGSTGSLLSSAMTESSPCINQVMLSANHSYDRDSPTSSNAIASNGSSTPFTLSPTMTWRHFTRATASHLRHLFSPHNILQTHTLLEYLELLFLSSMCVKLVFDYHWYPLYRMRVVEWLKHTSIVLESCLALPQAIRNYRKGTTEGLSVVMVGGWVAGDFFKLCYFLFNMIGGADNGNIVFVLGCLVSISLEFIVAFQMVQSQPLALEWQQRILRSVRHWKTNKDDDAGESLLTNNNGQKMKGHNGLLVSFLRALFQLARGRRPVSNTS